MKQGSNPSELQIPPTIPEGGEAAPDVHDSEDDITQVKYRRFVEYPFVTVISTSCNYDATYYIICIWYTQNSR